MATSPRSQRITAFAAVNASLWRHQRISIKQKHRVLETVTQGYCELPNVYEVYGGEARGKPLFIATERSSLWDRLCCAPGHSFILEIAPYKRADEVLLSLEREGCGFPWCCLAPKPCLCCCACTRRCADGVKIHEGKVEGPAGRIAAPKVVGMIRQPSGGGGGCTPTLEMHSADTGKPHAYVEGPFIFGGCTELCCTAEFPISRTKGKSGDIGKLRHRKPRTCGACCAECCGDSDRFTVDFKAGVTPEEKTEALVATLLAENMYFESDNGMCRCRDGTKLEFTFFICYFCGCLCPCSVCFSLD